jgi:nucleotide-binding universal stress UspA family protein
MLKDVKKILVPVDFSDNSQKVFGAAVNVATKFGAEVVCIFVVQSFEDYSGFFVPHMPVVQFQEEMQASAEKKMADFMEDNLPSSLVGSSKVVVGDVGEEIVAFAAQEKIDMIVMGTHGYKGLERVLFGSVAEQVVKTASCPVLTVNPCR